MKLRCFIGSSVEGLKYAEALQDILDRMLQVTIWNQDIFKPGSVCIQNLYDNLSNYDIAVFIWTPDDTVVSRNVSQSAVRDNLLFEFGLFAGRLGLERVFIITPRNNPPKLPTDLNGLNFATYDDNRSDGNNMAALGQAARQIKNVAEKINPLVDIKYHIDNSNAAAEYELENRKPRLAPAPDRSETIVKLLKSDLRGLVYIDIDKMGSISDLFGIEAGNQIVITFKNLLLNEFSSPDCLIYRFFGDTFIINCNEQDAAYIAAESVKIIRNHNWSEKMPGLYVTCCSGWSVRKASEIDSMAEKWLIRAALGCINAKKKGGNTTSEEVEFTRHFNYERTIIDS